jgi:small subunit ribosomal protein S18
MQMQKKVTYKTRRPSKLTVEKNRFAQIAQNDITNVDYKNTKFLSAFIDPQGKIIPKKFNRLASKEQRLVAKLIKRARQMKLMPYIVVGQKLKTS